MSAEKAQVIGFVKDTIAEEIQSFLSDKSLSQNTRQSYKVAIADFFEYFQFLYKGKNITTLTEEDIVKVDVDENGYKTKKLKFTNAMMRKYRDHLVEAGDLSNSSINTRMAAIRSLFDTLAKDRPYFNTGVFKFKKRLDEDTESYGYFSKEEMLMMIEKAKEYPNGLEKSLLIKLACVTSFRCTSLLNLTWRHIKKHDENTYQVFAKEEAIGKRNKKDEKSIDKELYEELMQLKGGKFDDNKIFHMHRKSAWDLIQRLVDDLGLDPDGDRHLTFHSIRNFGGNEILTKTNDIRLVKQQMAHSSEATFLKSYAKMTKDPTKNPSLMVLKDVDTSLLKGASLEQLLMAIDKCGDDTKVQILNKLKEIMG
jgi:integrase